MTNRNENASETHAPTDIERRGGVEVAAGTRLASTAAAASTSRRTGTHSEDTEARTVLARPDARPDDAEEHEGDTANGAR